MIGELLVILIIALIVFGSILLRARKGGSLNGPPTRHHARPLRNPVPPGLGLGQKIPRMSQEEGGGAEEVSIDPTLLQYTLENLSSEQNLFLGVLAGAVAAVVGAALWAVVTITTGYQIGYMAVVVGFFVGFAMRQFGKGTDQVFGVVGAVLALLGCGLGNLFSACAVLSQQEGVPFFEVLSLLDLEIISELMAATFSPVDLLFYGIAIYEGYKLSFRQLTAQDLGLPSQ